MKRTFQMVSTTALILGAGLFFHTPLMAQDNGELTVELMKRISSIEEETANYEVE